MLQLVNEVYPLAAQLLYLTVAASVAGISFAILLLSDPHERAAIFDPWLFWTWPIFTIQTAATMLAIGFAFFGSLPAELVAIVLTQWIIVILGLGILPGGLILARRHRRKPRAHWTSWLATVATATILVLGFSLLWMVSIAFFVSPPESTIFDELAQSTFGILLLIPIAILAAPLEEAIFRLGLQGMLQNLEKRRWLPAWLTIVLPSAIWSLGHAGVLTPHGIKELQIFVVGLILGIVYRRHGFGACVAVHLGLNCGALALAPFETILFHGS